MLALPFSRHHFLHGLYLKKPFFLFLGPQVVYFIKHVLDFLLILFHVPSNSPPPPLLRTRLEFINRVHNFILKGTPLTPFLKVVVHVLVPLTFHKGLLLFHLPLLIKWESFQLIIGLPAQHNSPLTSSSANSTSGVNRVAYQRKLRLVVSDDSHHTRPRMDPDLDLQFQLIPAMRLMLLYYVNKLRGQVESPFYRSLVFHVLREFLLANISSTGGNVGVSDCFDLLNSLLVAENVEIFKNAVQEVDDVILVAFEDLVEIADVNEHDDYLASIVGEVLIVNVKV